MINEEKLPATTFLRAMGYESNKQMTELFREVDAHTEHKYIKATLEKDTTDNREEALLEIYQKNKPW